MDEWVRHLEMYAPYLVFAMFGGFVRLINDTQGMGSVQFVREIATAAFVGLLVYFLLRPVVSVSVEIRAMAVGVSGYCSRDVLNIFARKVVEKLKSLT